MLVLEDGDISQTNQAFDQQKAKEDKYNICSLLDIQQFYSKVKNDQWTLINVIALKKLTPGLLCSSG